MFYDRFYDLCLSHGVTPTKVGRELGIGQSTIAMWGVRQSTPKAETIQKLAAYFKVSPDYLLGEINASAHMDITTDNSSVDAQEDRERIYLMQRMLLYIVGGDSVEFNIQQNSAGEISCNGFSYDQLYTLCNSVIRNKLEKAYASVDIDGRKKIAAYAEKLAQEYINSDLIE